MKSIPDNKTVEELLHLRKEDMLRANPEYQRGVVWTLAQKKRLVDSLLRGYPIPLIYLHQVTKSVGSITNTNFEIIDGQQRITALYEYREGAFKLFDPVKDEAEARFPAFIKDLPCAWGGRRFEELGPALQGQFLKTELSVVKIETDTGNEARDLFIRLQAGMPLNSQEKRDAWPGYFTEYILKVGGKPELPKYPGHEFFTKVMKARATNRGEIRQLAAQITMLFLNRRETGGEKLCDINRDAIDTFYYKHLEFNSQSQEAKRFDTVLTRLTELLGDGKRKKMQGHEAIHLVLLIDSLLDDYTRSWESEFAKAFDAFRANLATDTKDRFERQGEYWTRYGQLARTNSDRGDVITRRHEFFLEKMHAALKPVPKDPDRAYGQLEREIIYYRDRKTCQVCESPVLWDAAEIHHVEEHAQGGKTSLANGALVHKDCHPKGAKQVEDFARKWKQQSRSTSGI